MKSQTSKVRIAALAVGLAIVMSSCGIQNQAGDSSSASGRTKNFALLADGEYCFDSEEEKSAAIKAAEAAHNTHHDLVLRPEDFNAWDERNQALHETIRLSVTGRVGNCPAPAPVSSADAAKEAAFVCVTPDQKQQMIDGYKEQIAKTEYPADWSAATIADYQEQMKRGLAIAEKICTSGN